MACVGTTSIPIELWLKIALEIFAAGNFLAIETTTAPRIGTDLTAIMSFYWGRHSLGRSNNNGERFVDFSTFMKETIV